MLSFLRRPVVSAQVLKRVCSKGYTFTIAPGTPGIMFHFQDTLPHLPVPYLAQSLQNYLSAVAPFVSANQLENTRRVVEEFGRPGGVGEELQKKLLQRAQNKVNWLEEWWLKAAYTAYRLPIVVHSSPASIYPHIPGPHSEDQQLQISAKMIYACAKYKEMIDRRTLPPFGTLKTPLCMSQLPKLFSACRVPAIPVDETVLFKPEEGQHVVIAHNNQFFELPVYGHDGSCLSPAQIYSQLKQIVSISPSSSSPPLEERVGLLTGGHRDVWAKQYKELIQDPVNAASVRKIQSCFLVVALDKPNPEMIGSSSHDNAERVSTVHRLLHGGGSHSNSGNRWFDKTLQFCIAPDGSCGCYLEHSQMDGVSSVVLTDYCLAYRRDNPDVLVEDSTCQNLPEVRRLHFNLTDSLRSSVISAGRELTKLASRLGVSCFFLRRFGHSTLKAHGIGSDGFVQLGIQLAHFRMYGQNVATYESVSTQRFRHARTDTARSATMESDTFVRSFDQDSVSDFKKAMMMKDALEKHTTIVKKAAAGQAFDRHLFGLRMIAVESGQPMPSIFTDPTYAQANHYRLSTSQVRSQFRLHLSFGPVVDDGYGIAYLIRDNEIMFTITTFNDCQTTDHEKFAGLLEKSLLELFEIIQYLPSKSKI